MGIFEDKHQVVQTALTAVCKFLGSCYTVDDMRDVFGLTLDYDSKTYKNQWSYRIDRDELSFTAILNNSDLNSNMNRHQKLIIRGELAAESFAVSIERKSKDNGIALVIFRIYENGNIRDFKYPNEDDPCYFIKLTELLHECLKSEFEKEYDAKKNVMGITHIDAFDLNYYPIGQLIRITANKNCCALYDAGNSYNAIITGFKNNNTTMSVVTEIANGMTMSMDITVNNIAQGWLQIDPIK